MLVQLTEGEIRHIRDTLKELKKIPKASSKELLESLDILDGLINYIEDVKHGRRQHVVVQD